MVVLATELLGCDLICVYYYYRPTPLDAYCAFGYAEIDTKSRLLSAFLILSDDSGCESNLHSNQNALHVVLIQIPDAVLCRKGNPVR